MEDEDIETEYYYLADLLDLPPKNSLIKNLSGGEQRRVSLAASLIHRPELLILDEPTVGLDPLLREKIWDHILKLAREEQTAVIMTTHYIEEAKFAHKIGVMRSGKLLAECSPGQLLKKFQCRLLEDAFLNLSRQEEHYKKTKVIQEYFIVETGLQNSYKSVTKNVERNEFRKQNKQSIRSKRYRALLTKNFLRFVRHPGSIFLVLALPVLQLLLFFNVVGNDPRGLTLAIVNDEAGDCDNGKNSGSIAYDSARSTCDYVDISCKFLSALDDKIAIKRHFTSLDQAVKAVQKGKAWATMHFPRNFSAALQRRRDFSDSLTNAEFEDSEFDVRIDMSDYQIALFLSKRIGDKFYEVYEQLFTACGYAKKFAKLPIQFEKPIFSSNDRNYRNFVAPATLVTTVYFLTTAVSSAVIIADRAEGVWDRSIIQGVKKSEILFCHLLTESTKSLVQVTIVFCLAFYHFKLPCDGSLLTAAILLYICGFCGICYGVLISVFCTSHSLSFMVKVGGFWPMILLCGGVWPLEGIPKFLRQVSMTLPTTYPSISLRGLMDKGLPMVDPQVYSGFLVNLSWIGLFVTLSLLGLRFKSK